MENQLTVLRDVDKETSVKLQDAFAPFFEQANEWKERAEKIEVTSIEQVQEMQDARTAKLELKNIRVTADKKRKSLKEAALREGRAIDGMFNIIKFLIVPIEEHLQEQEDFIKRLRDKEKAELQELRESKLLEYGFESSAYALADMAEEHYSQLLTTARGNHVAKKTAERKAEQDRIEKERAEQEERERAIKENEQLKKAAEIREKEIKAERQKAEVERKAVEEKARKEREKIEAERLVIEEKARIERQKIEDERRKMEAEKQAQIEADKKKQDQIKKQQKAERLAPDKKKLELLAVRIVSIELPELKSEEAKSVLKSVVELLNKTSNYIKEKTINL